jgi:hypothetical protein
VSKHTPGPWVVHGSYGIYAKGSDFDPAPHGGKTCQECGHDESECYDTCVIYSLSSGLIKDIKKGYWDDFGKSEQTSKADLRLIAAAPDLLKALIALERIAKIPAMKDDPVRVKARAAIAKARGGAL